MVNSVRRQHLYCMGNKDEIPFPIVVIFFRGCVTEVVVPSWTVGFIYRYIPKKLGLYQGWGQIRICICKYKYKYKYKYGVFVFVFVFDQISNHVFVFVFDPPYLVYLTNTFSNTLFPGPFSKHKFVEKKLTWIFFINMLKGVILFQNKCRGLIPIHTYWWLCLCT